MIFLTPSSRQRLLLFVAIDLYEKAARGGHRNPRIAQPLGDASRDRAEPVRFSEELAREGGRQPAGRVHPAGRRHAPRLPGALLQENRGSEKERVRAPGRDRRDRGAPTGVEGDSHGARGPDDAPARPRGAGVGSTGARRGRRGHSIHLHREPTRTGAETAFDPSRHGPMAETRPGFDSRRQDPRMVGKSTEAPTVLDELSHRLSDSIESTSAQANRVREFADSILGPEPQPGNKRDGPGEPRVLTSQILFLREQVDRLNRI